VLRLVTLGGLSLVGEGEATSAAVTQRRRLALLAALAAAGTRGVRRDKLIGLLWPERSEEQERHVLAQTVYALRRAGDAGALVVGGDELRLNGEVVTSDMAELAEPRSTASLY
jgi:DNA-binding SARP family transcriptional activator